MEPEKRYDIEIFYTRGGLCPISKDFTGVSIWEKEGMFRLIPNSVFRNPRIDSNGRQMSVSWEQGIDISPELVRSLLHEECDNPSEGE